MISLEHGDYYRISVMRINRNQSPNLGMPMFDRVKTEYTRTASDAGKRAGHWASDLPLPIEYHFTAIQYVEAC